MAKSPIGVVLVSLLAVSASAAPEQEDELAPLTPVKAKPKVAPPKRVWPSQGKAGAAPGKRTARPARLADDELAPLVPVVPHGELLVRVAGGLSGAVLSVDGKEVGRLPLGAYPIAVGDHQVTVARPGYSAFTRKVNVILGRSLEFEAKLTPVAAVLQVTADVLGAEVRVDGRVVGVTPIDLVEVPPGTVEVVLFKPGYREHRQSLPVVAGKDYPLAIALEALYEGPSDRPLATSLTPTGTELASMSLSQPVASAQEPLVKKWYFWVGVGLAVAGIAAATTASVSAALPPKLRTGTEICGAQCDACMNVLTCSR